MAKTKKQNNPAVNVMRAKLCRAENHACSARCAIESAIVSLAGVSTSSVQAFKQTFTELVAAHRYAVQAEG